MSKKSNRLRAKVAQVERQHRRDVARLMCQIDQLRCEVARRTNAYNDLAERVFDASGIKVQLTEGPARFDLRYEFILSRMELEYMTPTMCEGVLRGAVARMMKQADAITRKAKVTP